MSCFVSDPLSRLGAAGLWHVPAALALAFWLAAVAGAPAMAQGFDPSTLAPDDQAMIQNALEFDRTDTPRQLPSSRATFVITRTETRPRICRWFTLARPGSATESGVGCRVGNRQWSLAGSPTATDARPVVALPRPAAPAPAATTAPADTSVLSPGPTVVVTGPPATPAPPAVETAALAPTERRDFPRPDRRPGAGIPLTAAPFDARGFPVPARPPGLLATASPELPLPGAAADVQTASIEQPASVEDTGGASTMTRLDPPPDIPPPSRRPGDEQTVTVTIARFPQGSADPAADEPETAASDAVEPEPAEVGDAALIVVDDTGAAPGLERLADPPAVPLPVPRPGALARSAPTSGAAAGIPQPERKPTPPV